MGDKYKVVESVGHAVQAVHSYEDLEKHHPTWKEDPAKRYYGNIDDHREEFVLSPTGERMVSKDFVLMSAGSAAVSVPSPVEGYVHRSPKLDRWGTVQIYDGPGKDARLIAQVRHMEPIQVSDGEHVRYGQALGQQGRKSPPGTKVGLHTHMDVAESHLEQFKQYVHDLDVGVITHDAHSRRSAAHTEGARQGGAPGPVGGHDETIAVSRSLHAREPADGRELRLGEKGSDVTKLQRSLVNLGYHDASGRALRVDHDFGRRTEEAVKAFQRAHGLREDGVVGDDTRAALAKAERMPLLSEKTHPDNPMFQQARSGLSELRGASFRSEAELDRVAAAVVSTARQAGIRHIDHVMMNTRGDSVIAVQGNPQDPAKHFVSVDRAQAAGQSLEQSTAQLAEHMMNRHQQSAQHTQMEHMEYRSGLSVGMRP